LNNSLETVTSEPALYKLLTFQVPNLISIFRRLSSLPKKIRPSAKLSMNFRNNLIFYGERLLAPIPQPASWSTTPCRLSSGAYSMHSQLLSIAGGRPSNHNPRTRHAVVTRGPA
jgi:hypothetical protein